MGMAATGGFSHRKLTEIEQKNKLYGPQPIEIGHKIRIMYMK